MLNLSCKKTYDGKVVLDVGGLIFEKGKRYAVIGSNGSGKTNFSLALFDIENPTKTRFLKRTSLAAAIQSVICPRQVTLSICR